MLLLVIAMAAGLGLALGVLNVFFRDVGQALGVVLQFWFWFTPIVYPLSVLPDWARKWVLMNPMTALVRACQDILVSGRMPDAAALATPALIALALCALALWLVRRRAGEMVDEL